MTRKDVEARIELLKKERETLMANVMIYNGAIQDCEFWIAQFDAQEKSNEVPAS